MAELNCRYPPNLEANVKAPAEMSHQRISAGALWLRTSKWVAAIAAWDKFSFNA